MVRKFIIIFAFALLLFFFVFPQKNSFISVFNMTEEPIVISKGSYGQSVIIEVSFSHDGFLVWLDSLSQPYPLLMLDAEWIERSPKFIETIKKKNIPVGLLGGNVNKDYSLELFYKDVKTFEKHFNFKPLWFMTTDYQFTEELKQAVFNEKINMLSPTFKYKEGSNFAEHKGALISVQLGENSNPNFESLTEFINSAKFISVEENIFGYTLKTNKLP